MIKLLFALLFSISTAQAFDGLWIGSGQSKTHRTQRPCTEIYFEFKVTPTHVWINQGGYRCGILQAEYPVSRFDRGANFELLYQGEVVGFFDQKVLRLDRPEEFFQVIFTIKDQSLHYLEQWDDGESFLLVEGELGAI